VPKRLGTTALSHHLGPLLPTTFSQAGLWPLVFPAGVSPLTFQVVSSQMRCLFHQATWTGKTWLTFRKISFGSIIRPWELLGNLHFVHIWADFCRLNPIIWLQSPLSKLLGNPWKQTMNPSDSQWWGQAWPCKETRGWTYFLEIHHFLTDPKVRWVRPMVFQSCKVDPCREWNHSGFYVKGKTFFLYMLLFRGHTKSAANSLAQGTHSDSELPTRSQTIKGSSFIQQVEVMNAHRPNKG